MLSSFLLSQSAAKKGKANVDNDLDAIFAASAKSTLLVPSKDQVPPKLESPTKLPKRKRKDDNEKADQPPKKHKSNGKERTSTSKDPESTLLSHEIDSIMHTVESSKATEPTPLDGLEERYSKQRISDRSPKKGKKVDRRPPSDLTIDTVLQQASTTLVTERDQREDESSDGEVDQNNLMHESISGNLSSARRKSVYIPKGETKAQRDERTIFIGNLPSRILKSKPLQKTLKRQILSFGPGHPETGTKIESIRFRSVAFKTPTNPRALKEDSSPSTPSRKQDRAFSWRIGKEDESGAEAPRPKVYLSPAEKKRVAFIKGDFHDQAASVNAYAVFAHHDPAQPWPATLPEPKLPSEIAAVVVKWMNGTQFEGRTLRVDHVAALDSTHSDAVVRDPASTVFVGNLEFTAHEEDLRAFFETLLTAEMGPPGDDHALTAGNGGASSQQRVPHWVSSVRIIRDKDTQLGKGFGYVRFVERTCVDEVVAMEPTKLKFAKRKLRVTRCKVPGDKTSSMPKHNDRRDADNKSTSPAKAERQKPPKAKGDPLLGERLKGMSKEERREAKKQDANRLARRMEKKKARLTLEKSLKKPEKERIRVRKVATVKMAHKKSRSAKRTPA